MVGLSQQPVNMPKNYSVIDMVPHMGGHGSNPDQYPTSYLDWTTPVWMMGSYGGQIPNFETMIPLTFMSGTEHKEYKEDLVYEGQMLKELPSNHCVEYNGTTGGVTLTLKGTSLVGAVNVNISKKKKKAKKAKKTKGVPIRKV